MSERIDRSAKLEFSYLTSEAILIGPESGTTPGPMPRIFTPDELAAHDLLSELRTRIATQPLPYQYGVESRALQSLHEIFGLARKAMKDHPGCSEFARITTRMLNVDLRPVTAKWHRASEAGVLNSKDGANDFRADLADLRPRLEDFSKKLQMMAYRSVSADAKTPKVLTKAEVKACFKPVKFGLEKTGPRSSEINRDEAAEIKRRRKQSGIDKIKADDEDAIGLALSGGGIRSATFCLGVVQFMAERGLVQDFDYLSTVSGGGYTGTFISSFLGGEGKEADIAAPNGPDTEAIRHVRQNAKYLSAIDLRHRWVMVTGTLAGLIINWTAPLFIVALLAEVAVRGSDWIQSKYLLSSVALLGSITLIGVFAFGILLRLGAGARFGSSCLAWGAGLTIAAAAALAVEWGFTQFDQLLKSNWEVTSGLLLSVLAGPAATTFLPIFRTEAFRKLAMKFALYAAGFVAPILALGLFYALRELGSEFGSLPPSGEAGPLNPLRYLTGLHLLDAITIFSGLYSLFFLNINLTGPHKLYRDQLANTFVRASAGSNFLQLSKTNASGRAPYHLVNATVNLPSSTSLALRDRRGDFFLFSKHWIGSSSVGYFPTEKWWSNGVPIDLATAMAISGAAASPHMGLGSLPTLSALMTLLNIRLGYWIGNPADPPRGQPGFLCLMREMTGTRMAEDSRWLNVSDGGHIENMGLYELLRRRCKFIVCVDGEADPESTFHGQLTLVRHAQIDLGVRIEPRLDEMRPDPKTRYSRTHAQLFRIFYPSIGKRPDDIGLLLYLKLSLTGDEAELLKRYRLIHPEFPHQSTLDQFYDEEQFEAYRQLGVHVARGTFSPALLTENRNPRSVKEWFEQLARNMLEPTRP